MKVVRLKVSHFSPSQDHGTSRAVGRGENGKDDPSADGCHVSRLFCVCDQHGGPMQFIQFSKARAKKRSRRVELFHSSVPSPPKFCLLLL